MSIRQYYVQRRRAGLHTCVSGWGGAGFLRSRQKMQAVNRDKKNSKELLHSVIQCCDPILCFI